MTERLNEGLEGNSDNEGNGIGIGQVPLSRHDVLQISGGAVCLAALPGTLASATTAEIGKAEDLMQLRLTVLCLSG